MARCYVCHRRRPYKRVRATFDVALIAGRKITFVGSLGRSILASGGISFPPCLRAFPPCGAQSPTLYNPPAARRIAECANARRNVCALPISPLPIRSRRWSRAHFNASPLRRLPSHRGSCFLRSRSPRHASRRVWRFPTVGRRGWSRSNREGVCLRRLRGVTYLRWCPLRGDREKIVLRSIVPTRAKKFHVAQLRIASSSRGPPAARYRRRVPVPLMA